MTLVQVVANETSLHMACDFCLTNLDTGKVERNDAFKLISITRPSVTALIGVTGIGVLDGKLIGQWIAEAVGWMAGPGSIDDVVDALVQKAEPSLARVADAVRRRHTFVVGAMIGTQSRVTLVSNFERFVKGQIQSSGTAAMTLTVSSIKPKSAQLFATGAGHLIRPGEREELELALRSGASETSMQDRLSEVNAAVSTRTKTVSTGCYVGTLNATGRGSTRPFLTDDQPGEFIPPEMEALYRRLGIKLNQAIGPDGKPAPVRMVGSTFGSTGSTPQYFREQLKLQPDSAELWNNYGSLLSDRRKPDEAMDVFARAMDLDPTYVTAIANLANLQRSHRGDLSEADRLYKEAVRVSEPSPPAWILSNFAGFCDEGLSDPGRALELHERAIQDVEYPLAKARLAYFLLRHEQEKERATALLAEALAKQSENPEILFLAGLANWSYLGDREAARTMLQRACTATPSRHDIWRVTGDVFLSYGDGAMRRTSTERR